MKTTRPVRDVRTIEDIIAIEAAHYDELIPARDLYDLFLATADQAGDQRALTVLRSPDPADIGISLTHSELLGEITRAANLFRSLGIAPGEGVAAFLTPTLPELPVLMLGAQVAGVASSLNYLLSQDAVFDLLNVQKATVLVVSSDGLDETCWEKAQGAFEHVPTLEHVLVIGEDGEYGARYSALAPLLAKHSAGALDFERARDRDAICALFHTGGTTGRPKVVQLTHGNQIHAAFGFAQVFAFCEDDVVINGFPFFHVGGTMTVGLAVLAAGGHVVVPSSYALRPPSVIANYWPIVGHFKATVIGGVPTSIAAMTNAWMDGIDVSCVRMAGTGGAVCPKAVTDRFQQTTGIRLFETYGMTETAAAIAFNPGRGEPVAGSVGFRAPYSQIRIVFDEDGTESVCGPNQSGLVQVRGPQVFPGYADPQHNIGTLSDDGWLTTGDVGYLTEDSRLVLTGREKDLIVRSGHNIDPAAIEDVANQFAGVQISAAVGMPDEYAGEVPVLFVVPEPNVLLDIKALQEFLLDNVHEPPARPRLILSIDALPVTAVGKIFKPTLRDRAIEEKVRIEAERACAPGVSAQIEVRLDGQKNVVAEVLLKDGSADDVTRLREALAPLPQTYNVRVG